MRFILLKVFYSLVLFIGLNICFSPIAISASSETFFQSLDGRVFYGGNGGVGGDTPKEGYGIFSFEFAQGEKATISQVHKNELMLVDDGVYVDDKYYAATGYRPENSHVMFFYLRQYNPYTWEETMEPWEFINSRICLLSYDDTTGDLYGIVLTRFPTENGEREGYVLVVFDMDNNEYISIDEIDIFPFGMCFDKKGELYIIGKGNLEENDGKLYKVDKNTARYELIGTTGVNMYPLTSSFFYEKTSDKFYWAVKNYSGAALHEINLSDAKTNSVMMFPDGEQMTGLFTPEIISGKAPSVATDLSFVPVSSGALIGKIRFKVAEQTHDGSLLTGKVKATVYCGNFPIITLNDLEAGQLYETSNLNFDESGYQFVRIVLSNQEGESQRATSKFWIGYDYPDIVSGLKLSESDMGKPYLEWNAVGEVGAHGGTVNVSQVKYSILRLPDNVEIAHDLTATTYLDNDIGDEMKAYSYSVTPYVGELVGKSAESNLLIFGNAYTVPFNQRMAAETFNLWTAYDANRDGLTWEYDSSYEGARTPYSSTKPSDDWLFSPPIILEEGTAYKLSYLLCSIHYMKESDFKVTYGTSLDPNTQTNILSIYKNYLTVDDKWENDVITIPQGEGGTYYIGFHNYTPATQPGFILKEFSLNLLILPGSPGAVTDLQINYTEDGKAPATISFKAPSVDVGGDNLQEIKDVKVYRNSSTDPVYTFTNVQKGEMYSWDDSKVSEGKNYYELVASNSVGDGVVVKDSVYIGIDIPGAVNNLKLEKDSEGYARISWEAPTEGINKGYISTPIYKIDKEGDQLIDNLSNLNYIDKTVPLEKQDFISYTVTPYYSGMSDFGISSKSNSIRFGSPYSLPYKESFSNSLYGQPGWMQIADKDYEEEAWYLAQSISSSSVTPQDEDKGMVICNATQILDNKCSLISPELDFSDIEYPELRFWMYHEEHSVGGYLLISASTDGREFEAIEMDTLFSYIMPDHASTTQGWFYYEYPLIKYKGQPRVQIAFEACRKDDFQGGAPIVEVVADLVIDNIYVVDKPEKDLKVISFQPSTKLFAGKKNELELAIKNSGKQTLSDYKINLYRNNELINSLSGVSLQSESYHTFVFEVDFLISEIGKKYEFYAQIELVGDEYPEDNSSNVLTYTIERSPYSSARELMGGNTDGVIELEWLAPENPKNGIFVEEDFESYPSFIIDNIGEWTVVDVDQSETLYFDQSQLFFLVYAHRGEPMAYQVFNSSIIAYEPVNDWNGRSGKQALASVPAIEVAANNDWLISPELNGAAQEVTFYARGVVPATPNQERFRFYYSLTGKELSDFVPIFEEAFVTVPGEWTKYSYILPESSRYFAIQCVSQRASTFLLDDICFFKAGESIEVLGYNIYRNDVKLNDEPLTSLYYEDKAPLEKEVNLYTVTALYSYGESNYSNVVKFDFTDVVSEKVETIVVYTLPGNVVIQDAENKLITITTLDGIRVYNGLGEKENKISLTNGIYIVKVGNMVRKIFIN